MSMDTPEMRYRVTCELRSVYQLVVQATSPEEAESFADDIDLEKYDSDFLIYGCLISESFIHDFFKAPTNSSLKIKSV